MILPPSYIFSGYAPLNSAPWYEFVLDRIVIGSLLDRRVNSYVISDTGTSLIIGPRSIIMAMAAAVGARWLKTEQYFLISCTAQYDPIIFYINGVPYGVTYKVRQEI